MSDNQHRSDTPVRGRRDGEVENYPRPEVIRNIAGIVFYLLLAFLTYLMVLITLQYVPLNFEVAFLRLKDAEISRPYYQWSFFGHVYTSIFVLIAGASQFSASIRNRWPGVHRSLGFVYVGLILLIAAPTGLVMGIHANGGPWSRLSFCLQAILWFGFTWRALQLARRQDWRGHRAFMLRSYALTLSAITLRLWKWGIVAVFAPPPMDTYRIVAWLGWLGNLLLVEWWLWREQNRLQVLD